MESRNMEGKKIFAEKYLGERRKNDTFYIEGDNQQPGPLDVWIDRQVRSQFQLLISAEGQTVEKATNKVDLYYYCLLAGDWAMRILRLLQTKKGRLETVVPI